MNLSELDDALFKYFSNDNDKKILEKIIESYNSNDWEKYKLVDDNVDYLKNIVKSKYNQQLYVIIIITWNPNKYIKIHNHAENGCIFKILEGSLIEKKYNTNLEIMNINKCKKDTISYIDNNIGYHSITNNNDQNTYSLHVYSPFNYKTLFLE